MTGSDEPEARGEGYGSDPSALAGQEPAIAWPAYWLRIGALGIGSRDGELRVADGRISFATPDKTLFDVPVVDVTDVKFPRWQGGKVVKLKVNGHRFRIALTKPDSTLRAGGGTEYVELKGSTPGHLVAKRRGEELKRLLGVS
jgi:hypothetical protein